MNHKTKQIKDLMAKMQNKKEMSNYQKLFFTIKHNALNNKSFFQKQSTN